MVTVVTNRGRTLVFDSGNDFSVTAEGLTVSAAGAGRIAAFNKEAWHYAYKVEPKVEEKAVIREVS